MLVTVKEPTTISIPPTMIRKDALKMEIPLPIVAEDRFVLQAAVEPKKDQVSNAGNKYDNYDIIIVMIVNLKFKHPQYLTDIPLYGIKQSAYSSLN